MKKRLGNMQRLSEPAPRSRDASSLSFDVQIDRLACPVAPLAGVLGNLFRHYVFERAHLKYAFETSESDAY